MNFWEFELNTFDVWVFLGILVIVFLLANVLRRKVGFIRSSLLPTALIGGLIMLILKSFGLFDQLFDVKKMNKFMESVTYHTLALGVIALTLKSTTKDKNKEAQKQIFNAGLITVNTYLIQAIVGTALTVLLAVTFLKDLFPAAGLLLPLGFGQGSGQANNFGSMFQTKHGFVGGTSFGLSIATIGFLVAGIVGVFHINLMRRKGRIKIGEDATFTSIEETVSPNEIPVSETVDRLSIQVALIMVVYFITFLLMFGVENLKIGAFGDDTLKPMIWGFNFLIGSLFAVLLKFVFKRLKTRDLMTRDYPNNYLLNRISGFMFDLMIIAGTAAIEIEVMKHLVLPLVIITFVGTIVTYFYVRTLAYKMFPSYQEEAFVSLFGMLTGTNSTGMILLREVDPHFETPAASNLIYQSFYAIALGFPLFLLLGLAPRGLNETLITLAIVIVMFIAFNILLLRAQIFKSKTKKPTTS
ncbi:MAG: hypothetical protein M0P92_02585 [Acholeplasmataceae bacterium]|jgi:ESS family glutamate:Na+ symporter|nr:hypothetical protein [Acholeplasmataceae bacterium]MCK9234150.1 hypothetical protein [Acholeplasmataceae bacterium]MCK9288962.1 hypothetical protein [Acholeplasmataceae bacterium]MCK9427556.1 hypothetical protein [Acholeplasmataceae bacterium]